jgi:hypothetical protein
MRFCISRHIKNHFNFELKNELFISIIFPLGLLLALLPNFMKSCFEITMEGEVVPCFRAKQEQHSNSKASLYFFIRTYSVLVRASAQ